MINLSVMSPANRAKAAARMKAMHAAKKASPTGYAKKLNMGMYKGEGYSKANVSRKTGKITIAAKKRSAYPIGAAVPINVALRNLRTRFTKTPRGRGIIGVQINRMLRSGNTLTKKRGARLANIFNKLKAQVVRARLVTRKPSGGTAGRGRPASRAKAAAPGRKTSAGGTAATKTRTRRALTPAHKAKLHAGLAAYRASRKAGK